LIGIPHFMQEVPMVRAALAAITLALSMLLACSASADEFGAKNEAVAMVKRVQAMFAKDGAEATFKAVSDKSVAAFHDRDLYPFIYDMSGTCVAHGARPALIGKNLVELKEQDGKYLIREIIDIAAGPGTGWVNYKWPNPLDNKIEDKASYIEKMGSFVVGVGVYQD
jgi:signal transduction histidine kinase